MKYSILILVVVAFFSCGDSEEGTGSYENGVLVVNQGLFLSGSGTLTYQDKGEGTPVQNVFSSLNNGAVLGNIAQSMIEFDDRYYIAINNGGKIVVLNKDDFSLLDTISGINQSRYFACNDSRLFVSSWGADGLSGAVHEINTANNSIERSYNLGNGPEGMVLHDDKLYVARGGGFGRDSTVVVIDITSNEVVNTIVVGDNPEQIVMGDDGVLFVICNGYSDFIDPSNDTQGALVRFNEDLLLERIELPNGSSRLAFDNDKDMLYFNLNGNVVKKSLKTNGLITEMVQEGTAYALAFDEEDKRLYIGDANDFASQGEVFVYDQEDNQVNTFLAGIVPSYFHFQD